MILQPTILLWIQLLFGFARPIHCFVAAGAFTIVFNDAQTEIRKMIYSFPVDPQPALRARKCSAFIAFDGKHFEFAGNTFVFRHHLPAIFPADLFV